MARRDPTLRDDRRQRAEDRRQKEEQKRRRAEVWKSISAANFWASGLLGFWAYSVFCLLL